MSSWSVFSVSIFSKVITLWFFICSKPVNVFQKVVLFFFFFPGTFTHVYFHFIFPWSLCGIESSLCVNVFVARSMDFQFNGFGFFVLLQRNNCIFNRYDLFLLRVKVLVCQIRSNSEPRAIAP